jgi:hypothetical protein
MKESEMKKPWGTILLHQGVGAIIGGIMAALVLNKGENALAWICATISCLGALNTLVFGLTEDL